MSGTGDTAGGTGSVSAFGSEADETRLRYRLITGPDDAVFCRRISDLLDEGYVLYGSPAITYAPEGPIVAQAVILPDR